MAEPVTPIEPIRTVVVSLRILDTLPVIFLIKGTTAAKVAVAIGVSPKYLKNVIRMRQPLTEEALLKMSAFLDMDPGTLRRAAFFVTSLTGSPLLTVPTPPED